jgi:tetratricopeptide (TPR) repeat protein
MKRCLSMLMVAAALMLAPPGAAQSKPPAPEPSSDRESNSQAGAGVNRLGEPQPAQPASTIERQLIERLDSRYEKVLHEAAARGDRFRDYITFILAAATLVLAALGAMFVILAAVGFREIRQLTELRRGLDDHIVAHIKKSIQMAWSGLDSTFGQLPPLGDSSQLAGREEAFSPELRLPYEETDALVVLGDKLDALGGADKGTYYFNHLAEYWWRVGDWARGAARSERAIAISPTSHTAYEVYAIGLMNRSSGITIAEIRTKLQLLAEAERLVRLAWQLNPAIRPGILHSPARIYHHLGRIFNAQGWVYHSLGWIYDERRDLARAIEFYRMALRERLAPAFRARYRYDLACALCKAGQLQEALAELRPIIALENSWQLALTDPDFENLRRFTAPQFEALIEEGRKATNNSP